MSSPSGRYETLAGRTLARVGWVRKAGVRFVAVIAVLFAACGQPPPSANTDRSSEAAKQTAGGSDSPEPVKPIRKIASGRFRGENWGLFVFAAETSEDKWYCSDLGKRGDASFGCSKDDGTYPVINERGFRVSHRRFLFWASTRERDVRSVKLLMENEKRIDVPIINTPEEVDTPYDYALTYTRSRPRTVIAYNRKGKVIDRKSFRND